jgi:hypothetical protein
VILGFVPGRYEKCDCECFVSASVCDTRMCEDIDIVNCVVCVCVMTVTVFLPLFEDLRRFAVFPFTRAATAALVYCQPRARCQHGVLQCRTDGFPIYCREYCVVASQLSGGAHKGTMIGVLSHAGRCGSGLA